VAFENVRGQQHALPSFKPGPSYPTTSAPPKGYITVAQANKMKPPYPMETTAQSDAMAYSKVGLSPVTLMDPAAAMVDGGDIEAWSTRPTSFAEVRTKM